MGGETGDHTKMNMDPIIRFEKEFYIGLLLGLVIGLGIGYFLFAP